MVNSTGGVGVGRDWSSWMGEEAGSEGKGTPRALVGYIWRGIDGSYLIKQKRDWRIYRGAHEVPIDVPPVNSSSSDCR
jgi:hypothetical protein